MDAGYQGRGKDWAEKVLGLSVEVVHRTPKPTTEKVARIWAEEWAKEGWEIDWQRGSYHAEDLRYCPADG